MQVKLILPTSKHMTSFLEMAQDLKNEGHWYDAPPEELLRDFPAYLKKLENAKTGVGLSSGEVPKTEFWILAGEVVVGRLNVHHQLNETLSIRGGHIGYGVSSKFRRKGVATQALGQALRAAGKLGIGEALITCDDDNLGSIRVIEKNGGKLKDKIIAPGRSVYTRRYGVKV